MSTCVGLGVVVDDRASFRAAACCTMSNSEVASAVPAACAGDDFGGTVGNGGAFGFGGTVGSDGAFGFGGVLIGSGAFAGLLVMAGERAPMMTT